MERFSIGKRGKLLAAFLCLYLYTIIASLFPDPNYFNIYANPWINPAYLYFANLALEMYCLWGIWFWKKKAVYLKIITDIIGFLLFTYKSFEGVLNIMDYIIPMAMNLTVYVLVLTLFIWIIKRKWHYFS